jgi:hypothetical protein
MACWNVRVYASHGVEFDTEARLRREKKKHCGVQEDLKILNTGIAPPYIFMAQ